MGLKDPPLCVDFIIFIHSFIRRLRYGYTIPATADGETEIGERWTEFILACASVDGFRQGDEKKRKDAEEMIRKVRMRFLRVKESIREKVLNMQFFPDLRQNPEKVPDATKFFLGLQRMDDVVPDGDLCARSVDVKQAVENCHPTQKANSAATAPTNYSLLCEAVCCNQHCRKGCRCPGGLCEDQPYADFRINEKLAHKHRKALAIVLRTGLHNPLGTGHLIRNVTMELICRYPDAMRPTVKMAFEREKVQRSPKEVMVIARVLGETWWKDCNAVLAEAPGNSGSYLAPCFC